MNLEEFRKLQEMKDLGVPQTKVSTELGISEYMTSKYWKMNEDQFKDSLVENKISLDAYKDFILDIIKTTPTIPDSNIYYKILESFHEFNVSESAFRKYAKRLRVETGYDKFKTIGKALRDDPKPGEEAQIDFGQYKIKDMYGKNRILYFFVMVLRYSQLKYVYFSTTDFNSEKAIEAHKNAFRFFGGTPEVLLYDQDKVFAVSENFGNVILVKDFEAFLKEYGLAIAFCSGYHPNGKGTVENYVKIVKRNFLDGRTYTGIDSLNSACLEWLDNTENNHIIARKCTTPHELFKVESKYLRKLKPVLFTSDKPYLKVTDNYVLYKYCKYEVPLGYTGSYVKVESDGSVVVIRDKDTNQIICSHVHATGKDKRMTLSNRDETDGNAEFLVRNYFKDDKTVDEFLVKLDKAHPRFLRKACVKLRVIIKHFTKDEMMEGFRFCLNNNDPSITTFCAYLIYKYDDRGRKVFGSNYYFYKRKSLELGGKLNGQ